MSLIGKVSVTYWTNVKSCFIDTYRLLFIQIATDLYSWCTGQSLDEADHTHVICVLLERGLARAAVQTWQTLSFPSDAAAQVAAGMHLSTGIVSVLLGHCTVFLLVPEMMKKFSQGSYFELPKWQLTNKKKTAFHVLIEPAWDKKANYHKYYLIIFCLSRNFIFSN